MDDQNLPKNDDIENMSEEELSAENSDYKFKLQDFEGPLFLLLHLIKEDKLDIENIHLADITDQYLSYMKDIDSLDMDKASEFIVMAATLIELKANRILPRQEDEEEVDETELDIVQQLKELKLFQDTAEELKKIENTNHFYREMEQSKNDYKIILKDMQLDKLLDAFASLLGQMNKKEIEIVPKEIEKERFTIVDKIVEIEHSVSEHKTMKFTDFFDSGYSKGEIISVFLAILELLKKQVIKVRQDGLYDDIFIDKNESLDAPKDINLDLTEDYKE
jgi:segregation and condensation protein A